MKLLINVLLDMSEGFERREGGACSCERNWARSVRRVLMIIRRWNHIAIASDFCNHL